MNNIHNHWIYNLCIKSNHSDIGALTQIPESNDWYSVLSAVGGDFDIDIDMIYIDLYWYSVGGDFDMIDIDIDLLILSGRRYWYWDIDIDIIDTQWAEIFRFGNLGTFIFIIPSRNFLFLKYSISRRTNKYILLNTFTDLSDLSFDIHEIEFAQ